MAFFISNDEQKQHLNLSGFAFSILENDRIVFGLQNFASIINTIFYNFKDDAKASISIALDKRRSELTQVLEKLENPYGEKALARLLTAYKEELLNTVTSYGKGQSFKFRINNENYEYLTSDDRCQEEQYYDEHIGKYIKALIEEYARLPFVAREQIYFAERIERIETAIEKNKWIKVKMQSGAEYDVRPFKLLADKNNTYNYLVALSKDGKAWSYRISNLKDIKVIKSKAAKINHSEKALLHKELEKKGVQFLGNDSEKIKVLLTDAGKKMYNSMLFLRPDYIDVEEESIYCFDCTALQIEFYFFKFGKEARIVEPQHLKEKFINGYADAMKFYECRSV